MNSLVKNNFRSRHIALASLLLLVLMISVILMFSSCGGGATVKIKDDFSFDPQTVTIKAGETVTWKNEDSREHVVMSGAPPVMTDLFMSPSLAKGDSWSYTFEEAGDYPYHSMTGSFTGEVIVEP
jgi:plastocyanin